MKVYRPSGYFWIAASIILAAIFQFWSEYFIYSRTDLFIQPWRLLTAHWVHVGWIHYLLNMTALGCLPFIFPKVRMDILLGFSIPLAILMSLSFYFFYPDVVWYAGFSGVLHGLYALAALLSLRFPQERWFAIAILFGLLFKLGWEFKMGGLSATANLIGSPVLIEAHQLGVCWALAVFVIYCLVRKGFS